MNPASGVCADKMRMLVATSRRCMLAAQQRQKRCDHPCRSELGTDCSIGTIVLRSTANLNLKVLFTGTRRLVPKWVGTFTVTERLGCLSYRLKLPDCLRIHNK